MRRVPGISLVGVLFVWAQATGQLSRSGTYMATVEFKGGARKAAEANRWHAEVSSLDGTLSYSLEKRVPFDQQPPSIAVSDAGDAVVIDSFEGVVEFYSPGGMFVRQWRPFLYGTPDYERVLKCSLARERAWFLIGEPLRGNVRICVTDMRGGILAERELPHQMAGEINVAASGVALLAGAYDMTQTLSASTFLLDSTCAIIRELPFLFRHADFSPDGTRFIVAQRSHLTIGMTSSSGNDTSWSAAGPEEAVSDVRWIGASVAAVSERYVAGSHGPEYRDVALAIYDRRGNVVARRAFGESSSHPARFECRGQVVVLRIDERLHTVGPVDMK